MHRAMYTITESQNVVSIYEIILEIGHGFKNFQQTLYYDFSL